MKRIIHVHQQKVRASEPAVIVRTYKGSQHFAEAEVTGPCKVIHDYQNPLSCGAKVWIETTDPVIGRLDDTEVTI